MRTLPALGSIQRTNMIVACVAALLLLVFRSNASAISCLLGASVVIANLFVLAVLARVLLASAAGGAGSALGAIALPLKLIIIAGLVYAVLFRSGIDGVGFAAGVFTQLVAVLIETARANLTQHPSPAQSV
ncbi:MAG TPA: hypothetical protein VGY99_01280 [Candidatus Binataceae bacterium]|jgi:hypothetical protein|nr:hypothetical protein [Candidatus Binataceae bacterium]